MLDSTHQPMRSSLPCVVSVVLTKFQGERRSMKRVVKRILARKVLKASLSDILYDMKVTFIMNAYNTSDLI